MVVNLFHNGIIQIAKFENFVVSAVIECSNIFVLFSYYNKRKYFATQIHIL